MTRLFTDTAAAFLPNGFYALSQLQRFLQFAARTRS